MNDKVISVIQKAQQERKRGQFSRALKRLEQGIASYPEELDLYLEAIDAAIEGGEIISATNLLKTVQDKFARDRDRVFQFVYEKLQTVHDPSLARCVVEHSIKRRDLESALALLEHVPDHTIRELLNRARTKAQSLKSASHGGYTLRGETVSNELTNVVLSVRLGNLKEAMITLVKVVEDKPIEHRALEPFLASIAAKNPKSGRVRWANGCALRAGGNEIEAIRHFIEAANLEPACAANCVDQLRAMLENPRHPGKIRHALAECQLIKGDLDDAAETLRQFMVENPDNAREVIMMLRPFIDPANGINTCTWLAVEQAMGIDDSSLALEILRGLHQRGNCSNELFDWLEKRAANGLMPLDVMMFHGSLALDQKKYERATEILEAVCSNSSQDVPGVLSMISSHRSAHAGLDGLYRKHTVEEEPSDPAAPAEEGDFQMFESNEFSLQNAPAPVAPQPAAGATPRFASSPFSSTETGAPQRPAVTRKSFVDARELSLDDGSVDDAEEHSVMDANQIEITEEHVVNVGQQLYTVGAAAFFHIDEGASSSSQTQAAAAPASEPAATAAPEPAATAAPEPAATAAPEPAATAAPEPTATATPEPTATATPDPEPVAAPAEPEPFATRYERFSRGELSNAEIIVLLELAVADGRVDELHELLYFEPSSSEEHFARYYYQAEYHLMQNRPLQALEILARLETNELDLEEKRRVWYRIAVAQRMAHNYAGATETLERLVTHFPEREEYERLRRRNQEQYIASQSMAATTLEKTSSLD